MIKALRIDHRLVHGQVAFTWTHFLSAKNGEVLIWKFLEKLRKKSKNDKNARIQYRQISLYIELLQRNGVNLNENIIKHLEDGIWELRPGVNRIFFFYFENGTYVLLHQYRKKTQKTPKSEIKKAKQERKEYLQMKGKENENME